MGLPFRRLLHADWSTDAPKRWVAEAVRGPGGWQVAAPVPVGDTAAFVDRLFAPGPTLAGFDFPIGVPAAYGALTGLADFPTALLAFGKDEWTDIFRVAEYPEEISVRRPFYPRASRPGLTRASLLAGLGLSGPAALMRRCDLPTATRRSACPMFWTLGPSQVGKAAIAGWRDVIIPARRRGAGLWPYDGCLAELASLEKPVLAESYPAEAYAHTGIAFGRLMSKRRQADRRAVTGVLTAWAERHGVSFAPDLAALISAGFGPRPQAEDAFDTVAGLLGMIKVVDGRRPEHPADRDASERWEGWILGQAA